jgi:L-asparaginase II
VIHPGTFVPLASVLRGSEVESWHLGAVAVATPDGRIVARAGDPLLATCLRSAAKPFQALPLVASGVADRFGFDAADLALVCASHGGRPEHTARAAALLARGGFSVDDLQCGPHPPMDAEAAAELVRQGQQPTALHNNCSGKHAGMLLACRAHGLDPTGYLEPDHPWQRRIHDALRFVCALERDAELGIDGCSVPAFFLSLAATARGYAALADPVAAGLPTGEGEAAARILTAMATAPEMVAGPGRFTTALAAVTRGRLVGKEGAEGFYAVAVRGPVALGVALKIADGGERARDAIVLAVLRQLGVLAAAEADELVSYARSERHNHRGFLVGEILAEVELEELAAR